MALFPARSLWPTRERTPVVRLTLALFAAPAVIAMLFAFLAFLVAGMTETNGEGVLRVTMRSAATLTVLMFLFTMTFGLAGIALLWRFARRGPVDWALTGAAAGAIAGFAFNALATSSMQQALVITFAVAGWALFLLIRRFAGVRDARAGSGLRSGVEG